MRVCAVPDSDTGVGVAGAFSFGLLTGLEAPGSALEGVLDAPGSADEAGLEAGTATIADGVDAGTSDGVIGSCGNTADSDAAVCGANSGLSSRWAPVRGRKISTNAMTPAVTLPIAINGHVVRFFPTASAGAATPANPAA